MSHDYRDRIRLATGDITALDVDAVVTAANEGLHGGGGVDGAVHAAAGPELLRACRPVAPCPAGEARLTPGFNLMARHVIHAVGPIYRGGQSGEAETLRRAYLSSLGLAASARCASVAFPCISTGVYGFPHEEASAIAIAATVEWLRNHELPGCVVFCCYNPVDGALYRQRLGELNGTA